MQDLFFKKEDFTNLTDEQIVEMCQKGDRKALNYLIDKYTELVSMKVSKYFIVGAERDDIMQEGLIGLFKAVKCYSENKQSSFKTFANLCIERQLQTAIKSSNRQKHMPLNSYISLNMSAYDENEDTSIIEVLNSKTMEDPLDTLTKKEYYEYVENKMEETLSDFEKQVLHKFARGESYAQIAESLDTQSKAVDNAIQRIRKKTIKSLMNYDE